MGNRRKDLCQLACEKENDFGKQSDEVETDRCQDMFTKGTV